MIPENHAAKLREMFPLTAHGYTHREFVDRWHSMVHLFSGLNHRDPVPGWPGLMDFSGALLALKTGAHVARESWGARHHRRDGSAGCEGRYIALQLGYPNGIQVNQNTADATGLPLGSIAAFEPYLIQVLPPHEKSRRHGVTYPKGAPRFVNYAADSDDVLAEDWRIVCRPDDHEPTEPLDVHADDANRPVRPGDL